MASLVDIAAPENAVANETEAKKFGKYIVWTELKYLAFATTVMKLEAHLTTPGKTKEQKWNSVRDHMASIKDFKPEFDKVDGTFFAYRWTNWKSALLKRKKPRSNTSGHVEMTESETLAFSLLEAAFEEEETKKLKKAKKEADEGTMTKREGEILGQFGHIEDLTDSASKETTTSSLTEASETDVVNEQLKAAAQDRKARLALDERRCLLEEQRIASEAEDRRLKREADAEDRALRKRELDIREMELQLMLRKSNA